ncbi:hypothetical protein RFI_36234 [Reticulomyxa filosa]|uniref:Transmembrane protein n=1 Tax=Reticulomyxa filosa TaxID=46433 RepID=X6LJ76_RETFI|nr:hypothetical protein RFI_36234 [Reticulomyxa filosa]|eukprot:ETO01207.1 hypothetical protein RFI_36234 [Reticulomyxa filosa]
MTVIFTQKKRFGGNGEKNNNKLLFVVYFFIIFKIVHLFKQNKKIIEYDHNYFKTLTFFIWWCIHFYHFCFVMLGGIEYNSVVKQQHYILFKMDRHLLIKTKRDGQTNK